MQLNAGGRQVASDRGWSVVDYERLASWFVDPRVRSSCCHAGHHFACKKSRWSRSGASQATSYHFKQGNLSPPVQTHPCHAVSYSCAGSIMTPHFIRIERVSHSWYMKRLSDVNAASTPVADVLAKRGPPGSVVPQQRAQHLPEPLARLHWREGCSRQDSSQVRKRQMRCGGSHCVL